MNSSKVVSGHQPNFLPWLGYFEKMAKSDVWVHSDDVLFPKQSYTSRTEILSAKGEPIQLILPVTGGSGLRIFEKPLEKSPKTLRKISKSIWQSLSHGPGAADVGHLLHVFSLAYQKATTIAELNIAVNEYLARSLGIETKCYLGSELGLQDYSKNHRLIRRCELLEAGVYLGGQGHAGYQDNQLLRRSGIRPVSCDYNATRQVGGTAAAFSVLVHIARLGMEPLRQCFWDSLAAGPEP